MFIVVPRTGERFGQTHIVVAGFEPAFLGLLGQRLTIALQLLPNIGKMDNL